MNNTLYIPKTIHVGFNKRNDTYTKKLAYIIYTDDKGVKRKERSWLGWQDKNIPSEDFENIPYSGFVLNKGVGGARQSWGWNTRNEYVRVFDPRGFEFEISVVNLLFILQECTSTKGKGLEGEFVYSWSGKELVLLPCDSEEYKESTKYTNLQSKKITKSDISFGQTYKFKDNKTAYYLGRFKCQKELDYDKVWSVPESRKNYHVFYDLKNNEYRFETGFTRIAMIESYDIHQDSYSQKDEFLRSKFCNDLESVELVGIDNQNQFLEYFVNNDNRNLFNHYNGYDKYVVIHNDKIYRLHGVDICDGERFVYALTIANTNILNDEEPEQIYKTFNKWYSHYYGNLDISFSLDELKDMEILKINVILKNELGV